MSIQLPRPLYASSLVLAAAAGGAVAGGGVACGLGGRGDRRHHRPGRRRGPRCGEVARLGAGCRDDRACRYRAGNHRFRRRGGPALREDEDARCKKRHPRDEQAAGDQQQVATRKAVQCGHRASPVSAFAAVVVSGGLASKRGPDCRIRKPGAKGDRVRRPSARSRPPDTSTRTELTSRQVGTYTLKSK